VKILIDSDILIEILRGRNEAVLTQWIALAEAGTAILYSPISAAEIWGGAFPHEHALIARIFRPLHCVADDAETGKKAGDFLRQFQKSHGLKLGDAMIASASVQNHALLWTRNRKHFPMPELTFFTQNDAK
jgi:hypothetical protein